ncbi:hypothetical protein I5N59_24615 [Serratia marcescens]|uniref:hypothetical protein n=1 Tax=Serratia marcescens TaxID=615 RepID=UPI0018D6A6F8|nr:hypothetical protein [Serratia marcescens]
MKHVLKLVSTPIIATALFFSVSAISAPANADKQRPPVAQDARDFPLPQPPYPSEHMHKPGLCNGGELFCTVSTSDNPTETINKLTSAIPVSQARHYEVRISVIALPEKPEHQPAP